MGLARGDRTGNSPFVYLHITLQQRCTPATWLPFMDVTFVVGLKAGSVC